MGSDYSVSSIVATGLPGKPDEIIATFRVDNIAQEINETAQLRLIVITGSVPSGAIFQDIIEFVIEDSDGKYDWPLTIIFNDLLLGKPYQYM